MPKLVEHRQKRQDIIEATWRLIAHQGFKAATMREIATEAGYANGALTHYFHNKDDLLEAAFVYVWESTNKRIDERLGRRTGLAAIRIYCEEITPSTDITRLEAKIVLPFFPLAVNNPRLAEITATTFAHWRSKLHKHLEEARADGTLAVHTPDDIVVEQLLSMLMGLQILAVLTPQVNTGASQLAQIDAYLFALRNR